MRVIHLVATRLVVPLAFGVCCGCGAPRNMPSSNRARSVVPDGKAAGISEEPALPPEPVLAADVIEYVNADIAGGLYPGLVLGLIDEDGPRVKGFGRRSLSDGQGRSNPPDARTVYEIGSLTKVFTGTLLAQMSLSGEVRLDAPVAEYLPPEVHVSQYEDKPITLLSLRTHTSGLPPMPGNFAPANWDNPFADYTVSQLYEFLERVPLDRAPGARPQYSNVGFGLLGHALALRAGMSFDELVQHRISRVIGLLDTTARASPGMLARLATGTQDGREVPNWDVPTLAGAGGLRSTASDLLTFLAAHMGLLETPLAPAMALTQERDVAGTELDGLAWGMREQGDRDIFLHLGATGGYSSFFGFVRPRVPRESAGSTPPAKGALGVALLANAADVDLLELGMRLLDGRELPPRHAARRCLQRQLRRMGHRRGLTPHRKRSVLRASARRLRALRRLARGAEGRYLASGWPALLARLSCMGFRKPGNARGGEGRASSGAVHSVDHCEGACRCRAQDLSRDLCRSAGRRRFRGRLCAVSWSSLEPTGHVLPGRRQLERQRALKACAAFARRSRCNGSPATR